MTLYIAYIKTSNSLLHWYVKGVYYIDVGDRSDNLTIKDRAAPISQRKAKQEGIC